MGNVAKEIRSVVELRGLIEAKQKEQEKILTNEDGTEKRSFGEGDEAKFDSIETEIKLLQEELRQSEKVDSFKAKRAASHGFQVSNREVTGNPVASEKEKRDLDKYSIVRGMKMSTNRLSANEDAGLEREMNEEFMNECRSFGLTPDANPDAFGVPYMVLNHIAQKRTQTITGNSGANGGVLVDTVFDPTIVRLFKNLNVMQEIGLDIRTGLAPNQKIVTEGSVLTATWETETSEIDESTKTYTAVDFLPKRIGATTGFSSQSLIQSNWNMENEVLGDLFKAIDDKLNDTIFNGSGSGAIPYGLLNLSGTNAIVAGNGTDGGALTRAKVLEFQKVLSGLNANSGQLSYLSNTDVRYALMNTKLDAGSGRFLMENVNELAGYRYVATNHIPKNLTKGASSGVCSAMVYGDFSQFRVGQWGGLQLVMDYTTRKKESIVEVTAHSFWNMIAKRPSSFAVCKDILTA